MSQPIINKRTLYEFQEHLVANSTMREIEILFDSADIQCDIDHEPNTSSVRRALIERYYRAIDLSKWDDV